MWPNFSTGWDIWAVLTDGLFSGIDRRISELAKGAFRYSSRLNATVRTNYSSFDAVSPPQRTFDSEHLNGLQGTSRRIR